VKVEAGGVHDHGTQEEDDLGAGVPEVVPHSMRGLHSTIAVERGATGKLVASAIGHTSFERITVPHYLAPGTAERAQARKVQKVLGSEVSGEVPSKIASPLGETPQTDQEPQKEKPRDHSRG
jgi:hypothetical protein